MKKDSIYTTAVQAGRDPAGNLGSLSSPIYQSSVFAFPNTEEGALIQNGDKPGYSYGRKGNPTQAALEKALYELEGGEAALTFASGMAAISATHLTLVKSGDQIIAADSLYATTNGLFDKILTPLSIEIVYVDATHPENIRNAITDKTKVIHVETPANPTLKMVDLTAVTDIAAEHNLKVVMDNTFATPFNQRPLDLGVDIVTHSATKYLGGHGDLLAGAVIGSEEFIHQLRWKTNKILGGIIAPFTAWLVLRGIRTLPVRMERHNANGLKVAKFLESHPKIEKVYYPGLTSHPQHELAKHQMLGFGGMIAFEVAGMDAGRRLVNNLKLCALAVSLGNVETLIQHAASMTFAALTPEQRKSSGISDGFLRLSVGIERIEDIIADLQHGLEFV